MNEKTKRLLPGRLMLVAGFLFLIAAALGSGQRGALIVIGFVFVSIGAGLLRRARRQP